MKRTVFIIAALLLIAPIAIAAPPRGKKSASAGSQAKATGQMNIQVREVVVKTSPDYMAPSAGTLTYGMKVNVIGGQGNWYQVDQPAGWLPKSALTEHKVAVNPDAKFSKGTVKHDEVALAGKGFNPDVEAQFKRDNAGLAATFTQVDRVEGFGASDEELRAFQTAGKLKLR